MHATTWNLSSHKAGSMSAGRIRREDSVGIFWPIERQGLNDIATICDFATERTSAYATLCLFGYLLNGDKPGLRPSDGDQCIGDLRVKMQVLSGEIS